MSLQEFRPAYFSITERDSIVIATVIQPSLCEEDNIEEFGVELNQVIEGSGGYRLALDLSQVKLITSSAIGKLIGVHRHLHRHEGRLVLCGVDGIIHGILSTAKLIDYFHIAPTANDAVELLKKDAAFHESPTVCKPR